MNDHSGNEVILVHGLWYGSWTMSRLSRNLQAAGFSVRHFSYAGTTDSLEKHARDLHRFARIKPVRQQHFLGHSLGGLVILRMLAEFDDIEPGRVVLLGSPLRGSSIVRKIGKFPGSANLLGHVQAALEQGYFQLPEGRETGMIAGSRPVGLGLLTGGVGGPGDGTIGLHETQCDGLADHLVLPVTHSGMIYSTQVAQQAVCFLQNGHFEANIPPK